MSFEFTETLTIEVPDVENQIAAFSEKEYRNNHGLIIEVAAIHEGMTANFNYYPAEALEAALESWVRPYPKPIIMNHDPYSEPVGRVMAAKMEKEADGTPYTLLQVAITDPEAIAKVMDQRYLTGSVGGSAKQANCSICGADWAEASVRNIPCKHSRGNTYKGKLCYMEMNGIGFKEYSFVNMPADQLSSIRSLKPNEASDEDGWTKAARVFSLNMDDEEILEFSESSTDTPNILSEMRKKDATRIHMQLKGSFLSALAVAESEKDESNDEELDVSDKIITEEEEDVLAVAEGLSSDLSDTSTDSVEEEAEEAETSEEVEEEDSVEETEEAVEETEEEAEEGEKPEAQESPRDKDIDPESSSGAPVSREDDETEEVVEEGELEEEEVVNEEEGSETDLNERIVTLESRVEELEAREQALLEENAKLKAAIKRQLAERVVDTKIALGFAKTEDREDELNEHAERSAASLADSLRDLAGMSRIQSADVQLPQVNNESAAVSEADASVIVEDEDEDIEEQEDDDNPEDVFVDALMGRRKL